MHSIVKQSSLVLRYDNPCRMSSLLIRGNLVLLAILKGEKADILSINPLSEQLEELWVMWVYMQKVELHYWWEYGDKKT